MKRKLAFITVLLSSIVLRAQPFIEEIRAFQHRDSLQAPPANAVLFIGSSSLRLWSSIREDLAPHTVINRGFGGSTLPDVIRYVPEVVYPYNAKQIVIYCGENDFAASDSVTADTVVMRFKTLFRLLREHQPKVPIVFISIKPSPSRAQLLPKMREANRQIKAFLKTQPRTRFIDVYSLMVTSAGLPREELFGPDRLHMNAQGYAIWRKVLLPVLK
jgi:lysophospholipase L1-like esterase